MPSDDFARKFMEAIPHARDLNMQLTQIEDGVAEIIMPYDERLIGDPDTGVIAGGAVSAVLDTCCGAAALSHPGNTGGTATIDLRINYMRAARPGDAIRCVATCYHMTRSVAFVRAVAYDADADNPVATASGSFTAEGKT